MSYPIPQDHSGSPTLHERHTCSPVASHACGISHVPIHLVVDKPLKESRFEAICSETC